MHTLKARSVLRGPTVLLAPMLERRRPAGVQRGRRVHAVNEAAPTVQHVIYGELRI